MTTIDLIFKDHQDLDKKYRDLVHSIPTFSENVLQYEVCQRKEGKNLAIWLYNDKHYSVIIDKLCKMFNTMLSADQLNTYHKLYNIHSSINSNKVFVFNPDVYKNILRYYYQAIDGAVYGFDIANDGTIVKLKRYTNKGLFIMTEHFSYKEESPFLECDLLKKSFAHMITNTGNHSTVRLKRDDLQQYDLYIL